MTGALQLPRDARGSAMVMALFVLFLITGLGIAMLAVTQVEMQLYQAELRSKKVFYLAEAGLEDGRATLRKDNETSGNANSLDDELVVAAGPNGVIDFDADALEVVFDANGFPTGFAGYGDDVPVRVATNLGDGLYAAFLTNDAVDGRTDLDDTNERVIVNGVGAGPGRSRRMVMGVVEWRGLPDMPAAITLLGEKPDYSGGNGALKLLTGDDCGGAGIPGFYVPVVGTTSASAEVTAELGVEDPPTYVEGPETGIATVDDISGSIDPAWLDCGYLKTLAADMRDSADVVGDSSTPAAMFGTPADPKAVFIDDDYTFDSPYVGGGMLWVTGQLTITARVDWEGVIFVIGRGDFQRLWQREGDLSGAVMVANIAGDDRVLWTADDCAGPDGVVGNADDPFGWPRFVHVGESESTTAYCTADIRKALDKFPFEVTEFRQR